MDRDILSALREASAALVALVPLLPHEPSCRARPTKTPTGFLKSGLPCSCPHASVVSHVAALARMVSAKRNNKNHNHNKKKGGGK
jgi:hypothetical protein